MCWNDSGKECSSNDCSVFYLQGPPGMAFPRPEMYPGHQPGVPPNWNYQQFPAQMPQGLYFSLCLRVLISGLCQMPKFIYLSVMYSTLQ